MPRFNLRIMAVKIPTPGFCPGSDQIPYQLWASGWLWRG